MSRLSTRDAVAGGWVVCPGCRGGLRSGEVGLACGECGASYPVPSEGIPLLAVPTDESGSAEVQGFWSALHAAIDAPAAAIVESGELAGMFDDLERLFVHREHLAVREMPIDALAGQRVLEIGSGAGAHSALFNHRGAEMVSLDLTPDRVVTTARKLDQLDPLSLAVQGDARRLPFPDGWFDIVYSNDDEYNRDPTRLFLPDVAIPNGTE